MRKYLDDGSFPPKEILQPLAATDLYGFGVIKPTTLGVFFLKDRTGNLLRFEAEFSPDVNGDMDCIAQKWSRVAQEDGGVTRLFDITWVDIEEYVHSIFHEDD